MNSSLDCIHLLEQAAERIAQSIAADDDGRTDPLLSDIYSFLNVKHFENWSSRQQRGVGAYQQWQANVNNPASSAFGGNLHDLARRMFEAMSNADPQERSAEASSRADGEASAAKKPGATASTPCQPGEAETPCGAAPHTIIDDKGPWHVRRDDDGRWRVCSDDFTHDVELIVTGDFKDDAEFVEYAAMIARKLSGKALDGSEP